MFGSKAAIRGLSAAVAALATQIDLLKAQPGPEADLRHLAGRIDRMESHTTPAVAPEDIEAIHEIEANYGQWRDRLDGFDDRIKELVHAVAEGIERTARAERRVKSVVRRARKELAESGLQDPALEAEDTELRLLDGAGGDSGGVPPMLDAVEAAPQASSIPGVTLEALRRARFGA